MISAALYNQPYEDSISPAEWSEIYKELHAQSIQILPANIISSIQLSENDRKLYSQAVGLNLQQFYSVMEEQATMFALLSEHCIPVVILKGASAAVNYSHPEYRCMGDIDVLVPPEQFEKAYNILRKYYEPFSRIDDYYRHIGFASESGVEIELHKFFSSSGNEEQDGLFDEMLYKAIPNRVYADINGYEFPMLPPIENGLVLIGHINQHLGGGLGLRQIIDWMCYVEEYLDEAAWELFAPTVERIGMKQLAVVVTAMCQKYFGLSSNIVWCQAAGENDALCDELMEYILSHGNFGRKRGISNTKTVSIIRILRNPIRGIQMAQKFGMYTWDAYKKHRWLKPFAWIYQLLRWAKHGANMGVSFLDILRNQKVERNKTDLLERLVVTRR